MSNDGQALQKLLYSLPGSKKDNSFHLVHPHAVSITSMDTQNGKEVAREYHIVEVCQQCFFDAEKRSKPFWAVLEWEEV